MPPRTRQARRAPPVAQVATRLHSAAIHLLRRLRVEDQASGLTAPRLSAMSVIAFGGPVTLGDLARAEQVSAPTMSRMVSGLRRLGLVEVTRDPDDRRVQRIRATPRGKALLEAGRGRRVRRLAADLEALSDPEFAALAKALPMLEAIARP
ncbi:MAG: MarR family winged helix-turn-helix transcriptional regulator [Gemmatimonadales bacterium]